MAFLDGIRSLARGDVSGVARGVEKALAKSIPLLLGFLASLLGISGLTGKVMKIIKKVRKRVDKFINKLIFKAKRLFKGKGGKGKNGKKVEEDAKGLTAKDKKKHKQYVVEIEKSLKKPGKKNPESFEEFYKEKQKLAKDLKKKYNKKLTKKVNGKPIKTTITMGSLAAEKKDNDLDMKIKIAPNDASGEVTVPFAGDDDKYPGSGYDPTQRGKAQLWKDVYPKTNLKKEKSADVPKRVIMAKNQLFAEYPSNKKKIIESILLSNHGQSPRKFTSLTAEESLPISPKPHTIDRHMKGMGRLPTERDQAMRVLRNVPFNPGRAGFFKSLGTANSITHQAISKGFGKGGDKWARMRENIIQKDGLGKPDNEIILLGSAPSAHFTLGKTGGVPLADWKYPKYFFSLSIIHYGSTISFPLARGERPLWPDDPNKHLLADSGNPLTRYLSPSSTKIKILPHANAPGGWYILTSWPEI